LSESDFLAHLVRLPDAGEDELVDVELEDGQVVTRRVGELEPAPGGGK
jgi:hypothetical protein